MGSEMNNMNDGTTSFQPAEPTLCANGCGFFGSSAMMNLCSKCFRDLHMQQEQADSAKVAIDKIMNYSIEVKSQRKTDVAGSDELKVPSVGKEKEEEMVVGRSNKCLSCKNKVDVMGFKCRCGSTFCGSHRYPEKHDCTFDFRGQGKEEIEKANPVVKGDKLEIRI